MTRSYILLSGVFLLTGCYGISTSTPPESPEVIDSEMSAEDAEEASQKRNPLFIDENALGLENFPLSDESKGELQQFLAEINIPEIESLEELGGNKKLNRVLCEKIFSVFKQQNPGTGLQGKMCAWNTNEDGSYEPQDPLTFSLSELEERYLLLLIDENGLGAPKLFTYLYDRSDKKIETFDRPSTGETSAFFNDGMLYFVKPSGFLEYAYNVRTGETVPIKPFVEDL
jgi:hypothetical protein